MSAENIKTPPKKRHWIHLAGQTSVIFLICLTGILLSAAIIVKMEPLFHFPGPDYLQKKPAVGDTAPDFSLKDLEGNEFQLSEEVGEKYLVLEFGSLT